MTIIPYSALLTKGKRLVGVDGPFVSRTFVRNISNSVGEIFREYPNNSLAAFGGNGLVAAMLEHPELSERVICFGHSSWVQNINSDWENCPWGQSARYLPKSFREIAKKMNIPEDRNMTFGEMKTIEGIAREELKQIYTVYDTPVKSAQQRDGKLDIQFDNAHRLTVNTSGSINMARIPNQSFSAQIPVRNSGDLYTLPKTKSFQPLVIDGTGQNAKWAIRDFAGLRPIIVLINEHDQIRQDLLTDLQQANAKFKEFRCMMVCTDESKITKLSENGYAISGKDIIQNENVDISAEADMIFSARGSRLNQELVTGENVRIIDTPSYERMTRYNLRGDPARTVMTSMPPGSLPTTTGVWLNVFGKFDVLDLNQMVEFTTWKRNVRILSNKLNLQVSEEFFISVYELFKHANPDVSVAKEEFLEHIVQRQFLKYPVIDSMGNQRQMSWEEFSKLCMSTNQAISSSPSLNLSK